MPDEHARLSPSASARWLSCPASVLLIEKVIQPDVEEPPNEWAEEGTEAHELAYLEGAAEFKLISGDEYLLKLGEWELRNAHRGQENLAEMHRHVRDYIALLRRLLHEHPHSRIQLEQRLNTGVPSCWGTADAVIFSPRHIHVVDLKYGQGVKVNAHRNPQAMLYGVGALDTYGDILGTTEFVEVTIYQPRARSGAPASTYRVEAAELRAWRDFEVKPIAEQALQPGANFGPSEEACRFCPIAGQCRARKEAAVAQDFGEDPALLSPAEIAEALTQLPFIRAWCDSLADAATRMHNRGITIPGWKMVLSGGRRSVSAENIPHAIQVLIDAGYSAEQVARFSLKSLGDLEKLVGKKELPVLLGDLLQKSKGSPALVPESDNRPAINPNEEAARVFREADEEE